METSASFEARSAPSSYPTGAAACSRFRTAKTQTGLNFCPAKRAAVLVTKVRCGVHP
jgi:hypothetical protein